MADSFNQWWSRKYAGKNIHLMISKDIAQQAYEEGKRQGRKIERKKNSKLLSDIDFINSIVDSLNAH